MLFTTCSFSLRIFLDYHGYNNYLMSDAFLPSNFGLFIIGALCYRWIYTPISSYLRPSHELSTFYWIMMMTFLFLFAAYYHLPISISNASVQRWLYFSFVTLLMPILFHARKTSSFDRFIGDLSYPIYLSHMIVMTTIRTHIDNQYSPIMWDLVLFIPTLFFTTIISLFVMRYIEQPLDKYRYTSYRQKVAGNGINKLHADFAS